MCETEPDLSGVAGKTVGIQVFYGRKLLKHGSFSQTDATTQAYVAFSSSDMATLGITSSKLPRGRYHCLFLVNGNVVRARTIKVG
jgi:hypothetical protein